MLSSWAIGGSDGRSKRGASRLAWLAIPIFCFIASVSVQIFGPYPIGVADNNDFPKILGKIGVWVAPEFRADRFWFFVTDFRIDNTEISDSGLSSSELWIAEAAKAFSVVLLPPGRLDMRVLGGLHALLAVIAFVLFLIPLQTWPFAPRAALTVVLLFLFSDVEYVQFFSTAYMDAASLGFLLLTLATAWNIVLDKRKATWKWGVLFCFFGMLFLSSKFQHAPCVIPLIFLCWAMGRYANRLADRLTWLAVPAFFLATTLLMVWLTPSSYRADSTFSVVFTKLLPLSQHPEEVLQELNRPSTDLAYNHLHAFSTGSPMVDPRYRADFLRDVTTQQLCQFYIRHPLIALQILRTDFLLFAPDIPVGNFGTMRRSDYPEPVTRAKGMRVWSELRSQACLRWPWHLPLLYLITVLWALTGLRFRRDTQVVEIKSLAFAACAIGTLSFLVGSLCDPTETSRHIVLYQEATDVIYLIALVGWGFR